jgi:hypothetical protein
LLSTLPSQYPLQLDSRQFATVKVVDPEMSLLVAAIVVEPGAIAVARPFLGPSELSIVATPVSDELHVTA